MASRRLARPVLTGFGIGALLLISATPLRAAGPLTPEDVANLAEVSDPCVSPDGARVAYVQKIPRTPDEEKGKSYSMIWVVPAAGGEPVAYTSRRGRATIPEWSPDGRMIAFLDRRPSPDKPKDKKEDDTKAQLYVIPLGGGESRALTSADEGVTEFAWGHDASVIFFTAKDAKTKEKKDEEKKGRDWEVIDRDHRQIRLHRIDVASGESRVLTDTSVTVRAIAVSPDGSRIAALASDTPKIDDSYMFQRLVSIDATSGKATLLWDMPGKAAMPRWSPDGQSIACLAGVDEYDSYAGTIFVVPANGGEARSVSADAQTTTTWFDFDERGAVIASAIAGNVNRVSAIHLDGRPAELIAESGPVFLSGDIGTGGAGPFVTAGSTPEHPAEVFSLPLHANGSWTRLTRTFPHLESIALGKQENVEWQARDGLTIRGVLIYPLGYEAGKRYPLVIGAHGGPESAVLNGWLSDYRYLGQLLAHRGCAVLLPNYRGSIGRGVAYSMGDYGDPMGAEFQDVLDGIDALAARGMIDPERVGITGGSYGGYMTAWAATRESARFKAAVANFGVANLWSSWAAGDIPNEHRLVHWGWSPVDRPLVAFDRSPVSHVRNGRTPTLIMHGASDKRVHPSQSRELYEGLRLQPDLPVELVLFPNEEHGYVEAPHRLEACRRALDWFTTHLALPAPKAAAKTAGAAKPEKSREAAHHAH
jgi:dipeptidyl aminopeptidase/acylaminoacyl peptidase